MGRYDQAPKLINKKPKMDNNIIMITNEMYSNIFNAVGKAKTAGIVLVWLIGQADGFGIAQKTVLDAIGISKDTYYGARKTLADLGFLTEENHTLIIHYDKILGSDHPTSKIKGTENPTSILNHKDPTSILSTENPTPILGTEDPTSKSKGSDFPTPKSHKDPTPMGSEDYDYNIEEHIKTYKESKEKLGTKDPTPILRSDDYDSILCHKDPTSILTLKNFKTTVYQNSYLDEYNATGEEILDSYDFTDDSEIEEMSNEFPEAYSDLVKLGMVKRKKWSF